MSVIDIDAIEARAAAATPGPWCVEPCLEAANLIQSVTRMVVETANDADGDFIAAARTDVPALCALVRGLTRETRSPGWKRTHAAIVERDALRGQLATMTSLRDDWQNESARLFGQLAETQAGTAVMREALVKAHHWISIQDGSQHVHYTLACEDALASDAGCALAERVRMLEALAEMAWHEEDCRRVCDNDEPCDCGYADALAALNAHDKAGGR